MSHASEAFAEGREHLADCLDDAIAVRGLMEADTSADSSRVDRQSRWGGNSLAERRIDPDDGIPRTKEEIVQKYTGSYSSAELEAYWRDDCKPMRKHTADIPPPTGAHVALANASASGGGGGQAIPAEMPATLVDEVRAALIEAELEGDKLEMAVSLSMEMYQPLVKIGFDRHCKQVAIWCRMTMTKTLMDVSKKLERLAAYLELEENEAERLRVALEASLQPGPTKDVVAKELAQASPSKASDATATAMANVEKASAPTAGYTSVPPATSATPARKVDPEDGAVLTETEMRHRYVGKYSDAEVAAYFCDECKPAPLPGSPPAAPAPQVASAVPAAPKGSAPPTAAAQKASAPASALAVPSVYNIAGLETFLQSINLGKYVPQVAKWCDEMGAVSLDELKENWRDVAEDLSMKNLERKRFEKACTQ